jgi:Holliday junction DNA helicase RuvA
MIGYLCGRVIEIGLEQIVIDVNGVGYELCCSTCTLGDLSGQADARLWVHTHVREDAISLFGFASALEKRLFLSLLKVSGIGPKMAIKILSSGPLSGLLDMIEAGDVKGLSGLPKVGKKTAEQLVLSLRGKLAISDDSAPRAKPGGAGRFHGTRGEVASALVNLGFRPQDVDRVVDGLPEAIEVEQGVRQGLQALAGGA